MKIALQLIGAAEMLLLFRAALYDSLPANPLVSLHEQQSHRLASTILAAMAMVLALVIGMTL